MARNPADPCFDRIIDSVLIAPLLPRRRQFRRSRSPSPPFKGILRTGSGARRLLGVIRLVFLFFGRHRSLRSGQERQGDPPFVRLDLENPDLDFLAGFDDIGDPRPCRRQLGDVNRPLDSGSSSTNAPNSMILVTFPGTRFRGSTFAVRLPRGWA